MLELYNQGVSTRRIQSIMNQLGIEGISADTVSRMAQELDEEVHELLRKSIEEPIIYLIVDATYLKVRCGCRYINQAILLICGVREDENRKIISVESQNQCPFC